MPIQNELDPFLTATGAAGGLALLKLTFDKVFQWLGQTKMEAKIDETQILLNKERDLRITLLEERIEELEKKVLDDGKIKHRLREQREQALKEKAVAEKRASEAELTAKMLENINNSLTRRLKQYEPNFEAIELTH